MESKHALRVLILGSSEATYPKDDPSNSLATLTAAALQGLVPEREWAARAAIVYQMENMAERALAAVRDFAPAVVVLLPSGSTFSDRKAVYSVYHRFPRLYPWAEKIGRVLYTATGPRSEGEASLRAALLSAPGRLAEWSLGQLPLIYPEVAYAATRRCLEELSALDGVKVVCRLAVGSSPNVKQAASIRAMVAAYNDFLRGVCAELGIPTLDVFARLAAIGRGYDLEADGLHAALATRRLIAGWVAESVLDVLEQRSELPGAVTLLR